MAATLDAVYRAFCRTLSVGSRQLLLQVNSRSEKPLLNLYGRTSCPSQCQYFAKTQIKGGECANGKLRQNSPWASGVVMPETVWVAHPCPTQLGWRDASVVPSREAISGLERCVKINRNLNEIELGGQEGKKKTPLLSRQGLGQWKALLSLFTVASQLPSPLYKNVLLPSWSGDLHVAHHGWDPELQFSTDTE